MLGSRFDRIRLQLLHGFREFPDQKISHPNSVSELETLGIHPVHLADTPVQARRKERELIRVRSNEFLIHRSGEHIANFPVWTDGRVVLRPSPSCRLTRARAEMQLFSVFEMQAPEAELFAVLLGQRTTPKSSGADLEG